MIVGAVGAIAAAGVGAPVLAIGALILGLLGGITRFATAVDP